MTVRFALIGADAEAFSHPTSCTEPAPGIAQSTSAASVSVNSTEIATVNTADLHFNSHAHQYSDIDGDGNSECHDFQSHDIDPSITSSSVTLNGSPFYIVGDGVGTDPTSGGNVDIINSGSNSSVTET